MYTIKGIYNGQIEDIDTAKTKKEANQLVKEYRMAFGREWTIFYK
ncbi:MAG: hypothetical protein ACQ9ET_00135 [Nitrosomonadaceae bacterium]